MINLSPYFSLSFDESLNSILQKCQMDVNIRIWNEKTNLAETRYFDSHFIERPNADNLLERIQESTKTLNEECFLQLSMDGPNVNCAVPEKLDDNIQSNGHSKTLHIGSCAQHTVHGGFQTGSTNTEWDIDKIMKSMFSILHDSPARREIYSNDGETVRFPLRLVYVFFLKGLIRHIFPAGKGEAKSV